MCTTCVPKRVLLCMLAFALACTLNPIVPSYAAEPNQSTPAQAANAATSASASSSAQAVSSAASVVSSAASSASQAAADQADGTTSVDTAQPTNSANVEQTGATEAADPNITLNATDAPVEIISGQVALATSNEASALIQQNGLTFVATADGTATMIGWGGAAPKGELHVPAQVNGLPVTTIDFLATTSLAFEDLQMSDAARWLAESDAVAAAMQAPDVTRLTIPASVTSINTASLAAFPGLASIQVAADNTTYSSYNGMLFDEQLSYLHLVPEAMEGVAVLPASLAAVPACVITRCTKLFGLDIPTGGAADAAFATRNGILYERNLSPSGTPDGTLTLLAAPMGIGASAMIDASCTSIAEGAFWGNTALQTIVVKGTVDVIAAGSIALPTVEAEDNARINAPMPLSEDGDRWASLPAFGEEVPRNAVVALNVPEVDRAFAKGPWEAAGFTHFADPATPGDTAHVDGFAFTLLDDFTLSVAYEGEAQGDIAIPESAQIGDVTYGVSTIADAAFEGQANLHAVTIPEGVGSIGGRAFADCASLASISVPGSVTTIGKSAFAGCAALTEIILCEGVAAIEDGAFANTAIASIALPKTVRTLGSAIFTDCVNLTSVLVLGTPTDISATALGNATGVKVYVPASENGPIWPQLPASGNTACEYGASLPEDPITMTVGDEIYLPNYEGVSLHVSGDITASYTYKGYPIYVETDGTVKAKVAGTAPVNVMLYLGPTLLAKATATVMVQAAAEKDREVVAPESVVNDEEGTREPQEENNDSLSNTDDSSEMTSEINEPEEEEKNVDLVAKAFDEDDNIVQGVKEVTATTSLVASALNVTQNLMERTTRAADWQVYIGTAGVSGAKIFWSAVNSNGQAISCGHSAHRNMTTGSTGAWFYVDDGTYVHVRQSGNPPVLIFNDRKLGETEPCTIKVWASREGYTYSWGKRTADALFGDNEEVGPTYTTGQSESAPIRPHWVPNQYSISASASTGIASISPSATSYYTSTSAQTFTVSATAVAGYNASKLTLTTSTAGVSFSNNGSAVVTVTIPANKTGSISITGSLAPATYTVSFSGNGGTGGQVGKTATATYGQAMPAITTTPPTRSGYTFKGWFAVSSGLDRGAPYYTPGGLSARTCDKTSNFTLYALWVAPTHVYANGGSLKWKWTNGTDTSEKTVVANSQTWWSDYVYGFDKNTNNTLYLQMLFNEGTSGCQAYFWGNESGKSLIGWSTSATGSFLEAGGYSIFAPETNLYAQWSKSTITLDPNFPANAATKSTNHTTSVTATYNADMPSITPPSAGGYTFVGYYLDYTQYYKVNSNGAAVSAKKFNKGASITLKAKWEPKVLTLTLSNKNATTSGTSAIYLKYGVGYYSDSACTTLITSLPSKPLRTAYTFAGYSNVTDKNGKITARATSYYENKTFDPSWDPIEYSITYEFNHGDKLWASGIPYPEKYTIETPTFSISRSSRTGYTFTGWTITGASSITGGGVVNGTSAQVKKGTYGDLTATASWQANTYTVSFDKNVGDTGDAVRNMPESFEIKYSDPWILGDGIFNETKRIPTNVPTRTGYTFVCWELQETKGNNEEVTLNYSPNDVYAHLYPKDVTFKAIWTENEGYRVNFYKFTEDGAEDRIEFTPDYANLKYEDKFQLPGRGNVPDNDKVSGYYLYGWSWSREAGADGSAKLTSFVIPASATLDDRVSMRDILTAIGNGTPEEPEGREVNLYAVWQMVYSVSAPTSSEATGIVLDASEVAVYRPADITFTNTTPCEVAVGAYSEYDKGIFEGVFPNTRVRDVDFSFVEAGADADSTKYFQLNGDAFDDETWRRRLTRLSQGSASAPSTLDAVLSFDFNKNSVNISHELQEDANGILMNGKHWERPIARITWLFSPDEASALTYTLLPSMPASGSAPGHGEVDLASDALPFVKPSD